MNWKAFVITIIMATAAAPASAQTRDYLDAPAVKSKLRVDWKPKDGNVDGHVIFGVDDEKPRRPLTASKLFVTKDGFVITYPLLNPLERQAAVTIASADDPSFATLLKLLEAIAAVATTLKPDASATKAQADDPRAIAEFNCETPSTASGRVGLLARILYDERTTGEGVKTDFQRWVGLINTGLGIAGANGAGAVKAATSHMRAPKVGLIAYLGKLVKCADDQMKVMEDVIENQPTSADRITYATALLGNPRARLAQIKSLLNAVTKLADLLDERYGVPANWDGTDFEISSHIAPTPDKLRNVTIKLVTLSPKFDEATGAFSLESKELGAGTLVARKEAAGTWEIGTGPVWGLITRPRYGTAQNAEGKTVVARIPGEPVSLQPSVLVNFVLRKNWGPIAPMLQFGAATSKELPALLGGVGLRLFGIGKGDLAVGGGGMLAWYKDLQKLAPDSPVTGTKDIEADLGYIRMPKLRGYLTIQYKF